MKKIILILLLICYSYAGSSNLSIGLFGLKWGDSRKTVRTKLFTQGMKSYHSNIDQMIFTGGKFLDFNVYMIFTEFFDGRFYCGKIWIRVNDLSQHILSDSDKCAGRIKACSIYKHFTKLYGEPRQSKVDTNYICVWYFDKNKPICNENEEKNARYFLTLTYLGKNEIMVEFSDHFLAKKKRNLSLNR